MARQIGILSMNSQPNFTLILRAYDGRITGAAPGEPERDLVDSEIEPAQQLLSVFAGEQTMRQNRAESEVHE